jgi:RND family efflux transporter MFP subunit
MTEMELADNTPSRGNFLRGFVAFLLILVLGFVVFRVFIGMRKKPKSKNSAKEIALKVQTRTVQYNQRTLYLKGFGTAGADRQVSIVPEVTGKVSYTIKPFKAGTYVRKGALLVRIEQTTYFLEYKRLKSQVDSLRSQIAIANRALRLARVNLGRNKSLLRRRALDPGTYERAQQAVLDRGQRLEQLKQNLAVNKVLLRRASINLSRTGIRAPFNARIVQGQLTRGSFVAAGRAVGTLESIEAIEIPVSFTLEMLQKIKDDNNQPVSFRNIPLHLKKLPPVKVVVGQQTWEGRVVRSGGRIDASTRTLTLFVQVKLSKKQIGALLPGTFCNVRIPARQLTKSFEIPRQALYGSDRVYVVQNGRIAVRQVTVAYKDKERVVITNGLNNGDKLITTALDDPIEGTQVFQSSAGGKS